jgi:hypothetical protein
LVLYFKRKCPLCFRKFQHLNPKFSKYTGVNLFSKSQQTKHGTAPTHVEDIQDLKAPPEAKALVGLWNVRAVSHSKKQEMIWTNQSEEDLSFNKDKHTPH